MPQEIFGICLLWVFLSVDSAVLEKSGQASQAQHTQHENGRFEIFHQCGKPRGGPAARRGPIAFLIPVFVRFCVLITSG